MSDSSMSARLNRAAMSIFSTKHGAVRQSLQQARREIDIQRGGQASPDGLFVIGRAILMAVSSFDTGAQFSIEERFEIARVVARRLEKLEAGDSMSSGAR